MQIYSRVMTTFCRVRLVICGVSCRAVSFCNSTIFFCLQSGLVSCAVTTSFHSDEKFWLVKVYGFWLVNRYYDFYIIILPFSLLSTLWYSRRFFDIIVSICRPPIYVRHKVYVSEVRGVKKKNSTSGMLWELIWSLGWLQILQFVWSFKNKGLVNIRLPAEVSIHFVFQRSGLHCLNLR